MASLVTIDTSAMRNIVRRVAAAKPVLSDPFADGRGRAAAKIMRTGPKGVYRQFVDQTEYRLNASIPWARTKAFGSKKAPRKTMLGRGIYRASWLGGPGSIERITKSSVELGVDAGLNPQVRIHQSRRASTKIKPTTRMRFFLGLTYGVWLTKQTMKRGIVIARRRVSVSSPVRKEVSRMIRKAVGKKLRVGLTTKASR